MTGWCGGMPERSWPTYGDTSYSVKIPPLNLDAAYVRNMARSRVRELFGTESNSVLVRFSVDYEAIRRGH